MYSTATYVASAVVIPTLRRNLYGVRRRVTYVPPQLMWRPP